MCFVFFFFFFFLLHDEMHQKIEHPQPQPDPKAYNAVPPPPLLYGDFAMSRLHNRNPASTPTDADPERKPRRRRGRRFQDSVDARSTSSVNGFKEGVTLLRRSCFDTQESASLFQSSFNKCSDILLSGSLSDGLVKSVANTCTPNKARSTIPKLKGKDASKFSILSNGDTNVFKTDKVKYSPKVKMDTGCASKSAQDCSCLKDGNLGSRLEYEEPSTSNSCGLFADECGSVNAGQDLRMCESPSSQFCGPKGRYIQRPSPFQRSFFQPHWPVEKVRKSLEEGEAFCCKMRVNAHCRTEAYVSIDGMVIDVLIDGIQAQNRAIDGDVVAIVVNPVSKWTKLRGLGAKQGSVDLNNALNDNLVCSNEPSNLQISESSSDEDECVQGVDTSGGDFASNTRVEPEVVPGMQPNEIRQIIDKSRELSGETNMQNGLLRTVYSCGSKTLQDLVGLVASYPDKRPTGEVVAILEMSDRRQGVVGFLDLSQKYGNKCRDDTSKRVPFNNSSTLILVPSDARFPKMMISTNALPTKLKQQYLAGDTMLESELVAACVKEWKLDCALPFADISHTFGQGAEIEAQMAAILFEHAVHSVEFPLPALKCLPEVPWSIPAEEFITRKDLSKCRIFTIDPPTARDLDDALSIDRLENGFVRIGVHIADVSFFVCPETELDKEAQYRSTSVYLIQSVLPMLPRLLCEELCSLNPGVDRLAFSIIWDIDQSGQILDYWIGRTIINSCCKLSYVHAQDIIGDKVFVNSCGVLESHIEGAELPQIHGDYRWGDIVDDIKALHGIAKLRRDARFEAGALRLDNSRLVFDLDEHGIPHSSCFHEHQDSNFVVEEFMLLANMTAAKVIASAFPDCALLRRHPEPNIRKMKELEDFCSKIDLELNATSSGALHESLRKLCETHKEDPAFCSILRLYATKPMQLAKYFSTGELKNVEEWAHYALATPFYTHFTSPIRRYPDIIVHRTLLAALEAEGLLLDYSTKDTGDGCSLVINRCFTGPCLDKQKAESCQGQKALATAASKHKVPGNQDLALLAEHCNRRKLASRNVRDASDKLYLWAMLKKKEGLLSEARVLAVGPKFLSLYVHKIAMERRVYFEDTEGLSVEWLNLTGTVILNLMPQRGSRKERQGKGRALTDVAYLVNPALSSENVGLITDKASSVQERQLVNSELGDESELEFKEGADADKKLEPAVLPLTLCLLAPVPVQVFAIGGNSGPVDIGVRLFLSSYLQ